MTTRLFQVDGDKISSLLVGEDSLRLSSESFKSAEAFEQGWQKKLTLATKLEIKYDAIKSVVKEEDDDDVNINHKMVMGISGTSGFKFADSNDYQAFCTILEKEQYFSRSTEVLSPFKAVVWYVAGLVFAMAATIYSYYLAIDLANGDATIKGGRGRVRLFKALVDTVGPTGVLLIGGVLILFLAYSIWSRYTKPPTQVKFVRANA